MVTGFIVGYLWGRRNRSTLDPFYGDKALKAANKAIRNGDWRPAAAQLSSGGDRSIRMSALNSDEAPTSSYEQWVSEAGDATAYIMLARKQIGDAWAVRGSGRANTVDDDAWGTFFGILDQAYASVQTAHRLGPPSADAWATEATLSRGRQMGVEHLRQTWQEAHRLQPFHAHAVWQTLQGVCDKWSGSHDEMFAFARGITHDSPADSPVKGAVVMAHVERWLAMADKKVTADHYFSQPDVRAEVAQAASSFVDALPAGAASPEHLRSLNLFLCGVGRAEGADRALIKQLVKKIDKRPTEDPWYYWSRDAARYYDAFVKRVK